MTFRPSRSRLDFAVHQLDDPAIPTQALEQRDLVHISAHRLGIRLVERDPFDGVYLVRVVHHAVNARRAALADQIEPSVRLFAHDEAARLYLCDGYVRYLILASHGNRF